ncbi:unnamed protein product [Brassica oleracea var. botrytis]
MFKPQNNYITTKMQSVKLENNIILLVICVTHVLAFVACIIFFSYLPSSPQTPPASSSSKASDLLVLTEVPHIILYFTKLHKNY